MSRLHTEVHPVFVYAVNHSREHKPQDISIISHHNIRTMQHLLHSSLFQLEAPELHVTEFQGEPIFTGQFN